MGSERTDGGAARHARGRVSRAAAFVVLTLACTMVLGARTGDAADLTGKVVDADGAPLADAVVFVEELPPDMPTPAPTARSATMDQVQKQFVPRVLPVVVGTEVRFPNHDQIHHHVYSFSRTKTFELPLHKGEDATPVLFDQPGAVKIGCNIHDWMEAVIVVVPTPYHALTDDDGLFVLRDLPPGTYGVVAWHERQRAPSRQSVALDDTTAPLTFTIDAAPPRPRAPARGGTRSYE
jgi:plastocyanin